MLNLAENCFAAALLRVYQEGYAVLIETVQQNLDQYKNIPEETKEKLRPMFEQYYKAKDELDSEKLTPSFILLGIKMGKPTQSQVKAFGMYLSSIDVMFDKLIEAIKNEPQIDMIGYRKSIIPLEENRIFAEGMLKNFIKKQCEKFVSNWDLHW